MNAKIETKILLLRILSFVFLICFILTFVFLANAQERARIHPKTRRLNTQKQTAKQTEKKPVKEHSLVPSGKQADITIFTTGNVFGYIEPCG